MFNDPNLHECKNCEDPLYMGGQGKWYHKTDNRMTTGSIVCNVDQYSWDNPITNESPRAEVKNNG